MLPILVISVVVLVTMVSTDQTVYKFQNVPCQPLPHYVPIREAYLVDPLVVPLHRCFGKDEQGPAKVCAPKTVEKVLIEYASDAKGNFYNVTRLNHTSCHEVCRYNASICNADQTWDSKTCSCRCNFSTKKCEKPMIWQKFHCACFCPLSAEERICKDKNKMFSEEACGCVCKRNMLKRCTRKKRYLDPSTCECTDIPVNVEAVFDSECKNTGLMSKSGLIVVSVVEAAFVIGLFFVWKKFLKRWTEEKFFKKQPRNDDGYDNYSIETPTIDQCSRLSTRQNGNIVNKCNGNGNGKKQKKGNSDKNNKKDKLDIHRRPFLGTGGNEKKFRKYRYEMNNLIPIADPSGSDKGKYPDRTVKNTAAVNENFHHDEHHTVVQLQLPNKSECTPI